MKNILLLLGTFSVSILYGMDSGDERPAKRARHAGNQLIQEEFPELEDIGQKLVDKTLILPIWLCNLHPKALAIIAANHEIDTIRLIRGNWPKGRKQSGSQPAATRGTIVGLVACFPNIRKLYLNSVTLINGHLKDGSQRTALAPLAALKHLTHLILDGNSLITNLNNLRDASFTQKLKLLSLYATGINSSRQAELRAIFTNPKTSINFSENLTKSIPSSSSFIPKKNCPCILCKNATRTESAGKEPEIEQETTQNTFLVGGQKIALMDNKTLVLSSKTFITGSKIFFEKLSEKYPEIREIVIAHDSDFDKNYQLLDARLEMVAKYFPNTALIFNESSQSIETANNQLKLSCKRLALPLYLVNGINGNTSALQALAGNYPHVEIIKIIRMDKVTTNIRTLKNLADHFPKITTLYLNKLYLDSQIASPLANFSGLTHLVLDNNCRIQDFDNLRGTPLAQNLKHLSIYNAAIRIAGEAELKKIFTNPALVFEFNRQSPSLLAAELKLHNTQQTQSSERSQEKSLEQAPAELDLNQLSIRLLDMLATQPAAPRRSIITEQEELKTLLYKAFAHNTIDQFLEDNDLLLSDFANYLDDETLKVLVRYMLNTSPRLELLINANPSRVNRIIEELTQDVLTTINDQIIDSELNTEQLLRLPLSTGIIDLTSVIRQVPVERPTWLLDSSW